MVVKEGKKEDEGRRKEAKKVPYVALTSRTTPKRRVTSWYSTGNCFGAGRKEDEGRKEGRKEGR
jgi:hypothetical protein